MLRSVPVAAFAALVLGAHGCGDEASRSDADDGEVDAPETTVAPDTTDTTDPGDADAIGVDDEGLEDGVDIASDTPLDVDEDTTAGDSDGATTPTDATTPEVEIVTAPVRPPEPGELVLAELMIDPIGRSDLVGEWVELLSTTDDATLDLAGCWLRDGEGRRFALGEGGGVPRVGPGERLLVARSRDPEDNGGLEPELVYDRVLLGNAAGSLEVGCDEDTTLDAVTWGPDWPLAPGRALVLDGATHAAATSCAATALYDELNRGTPGTAGAPCAAPDVVVDDCALALPEAGSVRIATPLVALAWVEEAGATDLSPGLDAIPRFGAEIGLGAGADPAALAWSPAEPRPAAQDPAHAGRDHYGLDLPALGVGQWLVSARFSLDRGATWRTCGARAVTVLPSPCDPSPCVRVEARRCEGDALVVDPAEGACAVAEDQAVCTFVERRVSCDALAGRCDDAGEAACVDVAAPPLPGEIVITEVMKTPGVVADRDGEWLELLSLAAEPRQLSGCELLDDGTDRVVLADSSGSLTIWPGDRLVLAGSKDRAANGSIDAAWGWEGAGELELLNAADALILRCDGLDVDVVRWTQSGYPLTSGSSMQLSPRRTTTADNDVGAAWCPGRNAIQPGTTFPDYGSPGAPNVPCPEAVERCRLVAPPTLEIAAEEPFVVHVQLRHPRVTDLSSGVDDDGWVLVDAGLGNPGWYPAWGGWTWTSGSPDPEWIDDVAPLEDQWRVNVVAPVTLGDRDLAARVSVDDGRSWTDCDRASGVEGSDGSQDGYQPANASRVTVVARDPCNPDPCTAPPDDVCDEDGRLLRAPDAGVCTRVGDEATCDYPVDAIDCAALGGTCDAATSACPGAAGAPLAGEIVIAEVMPWPAAVSDFFGEWIELASVADAPLNLAGCELGDAGAGVLIDRPGHALVVAPGERVVLGRVADPVSNGGVTIDFAWGDAFGLAQDGDTLTLTCGGVIIDTLVYDATFPFASGVAMQLDPGRVHADDNDDASAWCAATTPMSGGDLGTPGSANDSCAP